MNEPRLTHPLDAPKSATPGVGFLWHPASALPCLTANAELQSWAFERGSLTRRLRQHWPDTRVQVLSEGLTPPLPHEAQALGLATGEAAWVRCVCLIGGDQARIYARTVIPCWDAQNPWAEVQRLGDQPLGELLFTLPDLERSPFEWALNAAWPEAMAQPNANCPEVLARRCSFVRQRAPLLLTEVFLQLQAPTPCANSSA
ncbi:MAG: chorismate lyase [Hydrogenophaga sp.]|nr:chorismate lyase [Hydrogenophaga sp.]